MSALRKFLALTGRERLLLLEAGIYLGAARAALLVIPFRRIARHLGRQFPPEHSPVSDAPVPSEARKIAWAVELMSRRTPWESACLAQSMAGKFMLRRRGFPSWLYLGMRRDETGKLLAHAWLRAGDEILLGGGRLETFTALSSFGEPAP